MFFTKIKNFFIILSNASFCFKNPDRKDIVIFDNETINLLLPLCKNFNYFVLKNRYYQIDKIFITFEIILYIIKNLFKSNLSTIYFSALIQQVKPKLVITIIDNSLYFSNVAKILNNEFKFLAIQGAARYDIKQLSKKFFIPEFLCFGEYEKDLYNEYKSEVKKFKFYGSLKQSYYLKSKYNSSHIDKYDIALLSEACPGWSKNFPGFEECVGQIANFTFKLAKKHNLKIKFVGKRRKDTSLYERENKFYKKYLKENFFIDPNSKETFSSYVSTSQSKLIIGMVSTLLRENLGAGKKILSCNFTSDNRHDFPVDGICNLREENFQEFEKRVLSILQMSKSEYFKKLSKNKNYVMNFDHRNSAFDLISLRIKELLI